jgi:hypothetical protein
LPLAVSRDSSVTSDNHEIITSKVNVERSSSLAEESGSSGISGEMITNRMSRLLDVQPIDSDYLVPPSLQSATPSRLSLPKDSLDQTFNKEVNKEVGPTFLEQPEDVFLVRNRPSLLKCSVQNALNAWFECSSGKSSSCIPFTCQYHC